MNNIEKYLINVMNNHARNRERNDYGRNDQGRNDLWAK